MQFLRRYATAGTKHLRLPHRMIGALFLFLLVSSWAIIYTTARNILSVEDLALQSLRSTAFALAESAENALRENGRPGGEQIREIFSDRVVAYALIANTGGIVSFHTNPRLTGSRISSEDVERILRSGVSVGRKIILQTGLPAYEFEYALRNVGGRDGLLRVVLHTTPADKIVAEARTVWWTVGIVLALLWSTGILLGLMFRRYLRLQVELAEGKRMALIGQMTAVLAHEIRNALASIKGYTQLIDEKTLGTDTRKPDLAAVLAGTGRIEILVNDLLLFSRQETYDIQIVDVTSLLREAAYLAIPSWRGIVEFDDRDQVSAAADKDKLHRVLANGIRNAVQAMGDTGVLTLSARRDGRWVTVSIGDTGPGIPQAEIPLLFAPFHTTKAEGTGLGLSYAEKVIKGMGGRIELVNRQHGPGAVLTIRLPQEPGVAA